jgi:Glycosyl transferases group 1
VLDGVEIRRSNYFIPEPRHCISEAACPEVVLSGEAPRLGRACRSQRFHRHHQCPLGVPQGIVTRLVQSLLAGSGCVHVAGLSRAHRLFVSTTTKPMLAPGANSCSCAPRSKRAFCQWVWRSESLNRDNRIFPLRRKPGGELQFFLNLGRSVVLPTYSECFGLPVVEALALGCPVIASTAASLREVARVAAIFVDPHSPSEGCSRAIVRVAESAEAQAFSRHHRAGAGSPILLGNLRGPNFQSS